MHTNSEDNSNIILDRCNLNDLVDYINDSGGEFGISNTKFGEVPLQNHVGINIESYLKYSLSIRKGKNKRAIGLIFLNEIDQKNLELSIILKEEYRKKNILKYLLEINEKFNIFHAVLKEFSKSRIITSVTKDSSLEKMLIKLGFILDEKYSGNNKVLYSFC